MEEEIATGEFDNGILWAHKQVSGTKVVHCALMFDIGSRDELADEVGLAHMWEHMTFKGTQKRSAYQVLTQLDSLGGELNAFTTKEKICFHASVLDVHFEKAVDLLTDIAFSSVFPEKELDKEKKVVLEEINMYHDTPDDAIQDDFEALIFPNHSMGKNILGTVESVNSFERKHFQQFISRNLDTTRVVFSCVGNVSLAKAQAVVRKRLAHVSRLTSQNKRIKVNALDVEHLRVLKPIQQAHCILGGRALDVHDKDKYKLMLLNNILGGPASNSLMNLSLREKYGFVYSVESNYHAFTDTGVFQVYFATEAKQVSKCLDLVAKDMKKLDEVLTKKSKLDTYKQQIKGQLAMGEENNQAFMLMMARSLLDIGRIEEIETVFDEVDKASAESLIALRQTYLNPDRMSSLTFVPAVK
jgi:predicted Zn-dependent peptidase